MKNEDQPSIPVWKRPWLFLRTHTEAAIGTGIAAGVVGALAWTGAELWKWLLASIQAYPAQALCLLSAGATTFAVWMAFSYRRMLILATQKKALEDTQAGSDPRDAWKVRYEPVLTTNPLVAIYRLRKEHLKEHGPKYICPFCYDSDQERRMAFNMSGYFTCQTHANERFTLNQDEA